MRGKLVMHSEIPMDGTYNVLLHSFHHHKQYLLASCDQTDSEMCIQGIKLPQGHLITLIWIQMPCVVNLKVWKGYDRLD